MSWATEFAERAPECTGLAIAVEQARGLLEANPAALAKAASLLGTGPRRLAEAEAYEDAGRACAAGSASDQATDHFGRAAHLYQIAGAHLGARRVREELRRLGQSPSGRRRSQVQFGWESLSSTELSVAELVADGLTNRRVGEILFMSRYTVDSHLRHIFAKLGLSSRVALASVVLERRASSLADEAHFAPAAERLRA